MQVVANGAHHHLARVQADTDAQLEAAAAPHLVGVGAHRRLHGQGRVTGAHGVVLVGNGRPKERHDAVAQDLVDGALVAVHGVHHAVDGGIEELLGRFGIQAANELGRVFDIRKEHGHLLTLAFQGAAGGQDFLREIGRGVGEWGPLGCRRWRRRSAGSGARVTRPDETSPGIIADLRMRVQELVLEVVQRRVVELKLPLQGAVGHPAAPLQHGNGLIQHLLKGHPPSSLWLGVPPTTAGAALRQGLQ